MAFLPLFPPFLPLCNKPSSSVLAETIPFSDLASLTGISIRGQAIYGVYFEPVPLLEFIIGRGVETGYELEMVVKSGAGE